jgi:hypothetical protein
MASTSPAAPPPTVLGLLAATLLVGAGILLGSGCVPYPAATTAHPVDEEASPSVSTSVYAIPNGINLLRDSTAVTEPGAEAFFGLDSSVRFRIDEDADLGIRVPTFSGFILNYKHRLVGADTSSFALAGMAGTGVVNLGLHWHVGATVVASGPESALVTPYGGLRGMQVVPLSEAAVTDSPTLGGFVGLRIGDARFGLTPELGVYYDEPALEISQDQNVLFVPSLTIHGRGLLDDLFTPPRPY